MFFIGLFVFVFIVGPSFFVLNLGVESLANNLATFFPKAMFTGAAAGDPWAGGWTMFYWCNWLSWAPISGIFLGRISYGHTIRKALTVQFVLPALFNIIWIGIFSGAAIKLDQETDGALAAAVANGPEFAVYEFLTHYPLAWLLIPVFLFITFRLRPAPTHHHDRWHVQHRHLAHLTGTAQYMKIFWGFDHAVAITCWRPLAARTG